MGGRTGDAVDLLASGLDAWLATTLLERFWRRYGDGEPGGSQRPALMPAEVWMHRRKGELCSATLNRRFFLSFVSASGVYSAPVPSASGPEAWYSASASVMMLAILAPRVRAWSQPP